jgi:hypothetical protein
MSTFINYNLSADSGFECGPEFIPENMGAVLLEVALHYMQTCFWASFWISIALLWTGGLVTIVWRFASFLYWGWVMLHNDGWHAYLIAERMRQALEEEEYEQKLEKSKTK